MVKVRSAAAIEVLREHLSALPPGDVSALGPIAALLQGCWNEFAGSGSERMHAGKLGRMEGVRWHPPVLSFTIERHGAMSMGSSRAELQRWQVDLDHKTARCERSRSYRQALPRAGAVRIEPIAREVADSILAGRADERLKWQGDETVRVLMIKIFPSDSGYLQTVTGRRKRLRAALETLLADAGWRETRRDVYSKA
jgi:hypothetical protein